MIHLNLHQTDNFESEISDSSFSANFRLFSPIKISTYQINKNFISANRKENLNKSGKSNSILQQRRALRNILDHDLPKPTFKYKNFQVRGMKQPSKQFSLSPVLAKTRKSLLSPRSPKADTFKVQEEKNFVKSITMNSLRRCVPVEHPFIEDIEVDSNEESIRISAKYNHN